MKTKLIIPILIFIIACNPNDKPMNDSQKEEVEREAKNVIKKVFDILASGNAEKRMTICENSPDFTFVLDNNVFSYEGLETYVLEALQDAEKEVLTTKYEQFIIIDPECFTYVWHGKIDIFLTSGATINFNDYFSTWTFKKSEGKWKMVSGHESFAAPMPDESI